MQTSSKVIFAVTPWAGPLPKGQVAVYVEVEAKLQFIEGIAVRHHILDLESSSAVKGTGSTVERRSQQCLYESQSYLLAASREKLASS